MIKFFRKIRQNLLSEGKTGKYFKYALGEIALVVIGILIALQINNWNSDQKDRLKEKEYLENFLVEIKGDSLFLNSFLTIRYPLKIKGLELARNYVKYGMEIKDTANFLQSVGIGGTLSRAVVFEESSTYQDIISTGNLKLIRNKNLQLQIIRYYTSISNTTAQINNMKSEYATFMNSLNPYDPQGNFRSDNKDFKRALQLMKSDEFLSLANQELTYAFTLKRRMESVNSNLNPLIAAINTELNILN